MRKNGKRLIVSIGTVLTALCITAGATMAWFNDTELLAADFTAGKLDITVTSDRADPGMEKIDFANLRPMTEDAFAEELAESNKKIGNDNMEGYEPAPVYFQPVTVRNAGTLPVQVLFTMADIGPDGKVDVDEVTVENVKINGTIYGEKVTQTGQKVACDDTNYILKDRLKIYIYRKAADGTWERVPQVNLNEASLEEGEISEYRPFTSGAPLPAGAGNSEQFLIAGYLPEDVGNAYQAKHYHGALLVYAGQLDGGAEWGPIAPEKRSAPTVSGEPEKAFFMEYYTIRFRESFSVIDAWKDAVTNVTVNGETYRKTNTISYDSNKTYSLPGSDNEIQIGSESFISGKTYHVVITAEGYQDFTCDILAK